MSRADDLVLCAVTRVAEVGVDVERVRSGGVDALTRWLCSPTTNHLLDALPQSVRERAFFRGWTRMEAHSKARGEGLTLERAIFERFLDLHHPTNAALVRDGVSHDGWWLHDFSPRRGYVAAVAARGAKLRVSNWIWHVDSTL
jgi:4'-phosphopantetheinyl transferase